MLKSKEIDSSKRIPKNSSVDVYKKHGFVSHVTRSGSAMDLTEILHPSARNPEEIRFPVLISYPLAHHVGIMPIMLVSANDEQKEYYLYNKIIDPNKNVWVHSCLTRTECGFRPSLTW